MIKQGTAALNHDYVAKVPFQYSKANWRWQISDYQVVGVKVEKVGHRFAEQRQRARRAGEGGCWRAAAGLGGRQLLLLLVVEEQNYAAARGKVQPWQRLVKHHLIRCSCCRRTVESRYTINLAKGKS